MSEGVRLYLIYVVNEVGHHNEIEYYLLYYLIESKIANC